MISASKGAHDSKIGAQFRIHHGAHCARLDEADLLNSRRGQIYKLSIMPKNVEQRSCEMPTAPTAES